MKSTLLKSTGVVALSTFASRIMGFIRDMIIANYFGASGKLDGFWIAFRIPNLLRRLVAEGALTISFIPVYTDYLVNKGRHEALELAQKTFSFLILILLIFTLLGVIFSPQIVELFAYGFTDAEIIDLTTSLNRMLFPYLFLIGIVAFAMGILNSHRIFFPSSFSPVLLNVGFITGAVILTKFFKEPLFGLALGVIVGGILQVLLQIPYLIKIRFKIKFKIDINDPGIQKIFRMIVPALWGIGIYQVNILMSTMLASMLPEGSISYLYYSDRLTELVLGVFIISIGNVILPEMSKFSANNDFHKLGELYSSSIRISLFIAIPATIAIMTVGTPIISTLFMRGKLTSYHVEMIYRALLFASPGIISLAILRITTPAFYSLKDTKTPVLSSAISFILNIVLGYILMQTWMKHAGLSLANSISATAQTLFLIICFQRKIGRVEILSLVVPVIKYTISGAVMALVIWSLSGYIDWVYDPYINRLGFLIIIIISGGLTYCLICYILKVGEIRFLVNLIYKKNGGDSA
ncbi:MAG: murein biosynthesis integral membrane protein MurJ [Spirochaetota bacterium]|nr:murein biosynthesis integral membrane protein MurJ [Spirochaetota bacterium]